MLGLSSVGGIMFPQRQARRYGILPIVASELLVVNERDLQERHSDWSQFMSDIRCREEALAHEWIMNLGRGTANDKVIHLICELGYRLDLRTSEAYRFPLTQAQIGEITCQTSINVNRVLSDLEARGLIKRNGRLWSCDWDTLEREINFDPSYLVDFGN